MSDDPALLDDEFELFPTIPTFDDDTAPEDDALALVDDLADEDARADDPQPALTGGRAGVQGDGEFAFDWDTNEFFGTAGGDVEFVTGQDATVERALKMLHTERGEYVIYPEDVGVAIRRLLGMALPSAALYSELAREIREGLMRLEEIVDVDVENLYVDERFDASALLATITLTTHTDPMPITMEVAL
jgi:hypothetical protein